ncbi:hypothetical protein HNR46_003763 [Haloferula luteola]|uniref:ECF transporter S component n=1 Tax=Haloferula luteola TaxID=595692 RepID=A0A840V6A7_9BACT|nr:DUF6580 family putative transport protein [Haloferula luteola]MBB5353502.1 hypothetical protein [Haloferula luteola]
MRTTWLASASVLVLLVAFRLISAAGFLPNFSPLPAIFLCSLIFLKGRTAWILPLLAWLVSDPFVSLIQKSPVLGYHHLAIFTGLATVAGIGVFLRRRPTPLVALGGSLAASLLFYAVSNTFSFATDPIYSKTLEGFVQAQWTGPVGFGPTWLFLRNLALGNFLFTGLFVAVLYPFQLRNRSMVQGSVQHS